MKGSFLFILLSINLLFGEERAFYEEEFDARKEGIFLPVDIDGKECLFLFDTGASFVVLDKRFQHLLGDPLSLKEAESQLGLKLSEQGIITPNGEIALELYKAVPLKLGRFQIANRFPYLLADLKPLWPLSGVEFCGVLGSSFLHQFRWEIDFKEGRIKGYIGVEPYEEDESDAIPIHWSRAFIPQLELVLYDRKLLFDIDTGDIGSGRFKIENLDFLKENNALASSQQKEVFTISGSSYHKEFRLKNLYVNGHLYSGTVFQESKQNALGMGFLKRHKVVLDFPFDKLYLEHYEADKSREEVDKSGIRLVLQDGKIKIHEIIPLAGAMTKGLMRGDEIVSIKGEEKISLYKARELFRGEAGRRFSLGIRRDTLMIEVDIVLGKDPLPSDL